MNIFHRILRNALLRNALAASIALAGGHASASGLTLTVDTRHPGAPVQSTMYGLFFEDINFAADGGLYAEMVKNRSFEFPQHLMGWNAFGSVEVIDSGSPFDRNPHFVRLSDPGHPHKHSGLDNEGFFGMYFSKGETYRLSFYARAAGSNPASLRVELEDPASGTGSQVMAHADFQIESPEWTRYTAELTPKATVEGGKLRIFLTSPASPADIEHVSLFPASTWKERDNGLRRDLAQALSDLKPGVLRFPGGCIVEGTDIDTRYQWKNSVGPVENRPLNENRWHYTFTNRFYPDYFQTYGLGFYEFFLLAEDIGAEPLPIVNVGLACQYQNDTPDAHIPLDSLDAYIRDAIDLVEFANGAVDSPWGSLRASMGHPEPFGLKYIGIGNEQWGPDYTTRLRPFVKAMRKECPDIKIVGSSGPDSEGKQFDYLWPEMKAVGADLVDEHFYRPEEWFLSQGTRYDNYDRKGPKVFAGEYACHGKDHHNWNHFNSALMEAAFMTGLERNADIVEMATYAPLFAHTEGWQWRPDMIWFDNFRSMPTASYFVQQLYSLNKGTRTVPLKMDGKAVAGNEGQNGLFASAVMDEPSGTLIVKVANTSDEPQDLVIDFKGLKKNQNYTSMEVTTLHSDNLLSENSLDDQTIIQPKTSTQACNAKNGMNMTIPARTFTVYRLK